MRISNQDRDCGLRFTKSQSSIAIRILNPISKSAFLVLNLRYDAILARFVTRATVASLPQTKMYSRLRR
jgi:hypothetical protein